MRPGQPQIIRLVGVATVLGALAAPISTADAASKRDPSIRAEFQRQNPCPSTGKNRGRCPGFQVDHRIPLCFHGVDEVWNLQWLSVIDHKAKTRLDVKTCRWDGK